MTDEKIFLVLADEEMSKLLKDGYIANRSTELTKEEIDAIRILVEEQEIQISSTFWQNLLKKLESMH